MSAVEITQYINDFFTPDNYLNAVLDYLEGSTFPQLLDQIEELLVDQHGLDSQQQEQLHELLASSDFETAFKTSWSEDLQGDYEEYDGSAEDFVADLEWPGL